MGIRQWFKSMELSIDTVIRGKHIYKEISAPVIGECVQCEIEPKNDHDLYAVAMKKRDLDRDRVVGHVPLVISTLCHLFLSRGGTISCTVIGMRRYSTDLPQGGLMFLVNWHFEVIKPWFKRSRDLRPNPPSIVVKSSLVQKNVEMGQ